jgi:hypothetical protein
LHRDLKDRVQALQAAVVAGEPADAPRRAVLDFLDGELLPHAAAEEAALYPAGDSGLTALLVRAMREEHRGLIGQVDRLRGADESVAAASVATAILALFESHLWKENDLLLPALVADPNVSLDALLRGMHELVG